MEQVGVAYGQGHELISRDHLIKMCSSMVRKDFEILRVQDALYSVFNSTEFYSNYNDELLSIKHSIELASGTLIKKEAEDTYYGLVCDVAVALGVNVKWRSENCIKAIAQNANRLVEIIFESCEMEGEEEKQRSFIKGFKEYFPEATVPFVEKRHRELVSGVRSGLSFGG